MQLCWRCTKFAGGCRWTEVDPETNKVRFEPIPGWVATPRTLRGQPPQTTMDTFEIMECPEFDDDHKQMPDELLLRRIIAMKKDGMSYAEIGRQLGLKYQSIQWRWKHAVEKGLVEPE